MELLTIDVNNIVVPNKLNSFKELIQPIPTTSDKLGLYVRVPTSTIDVLNGKSKGSDRVMYLNSTEFVSSITGYAYVCYNDDKGVCEIIRISGLTVKEVVVHTVGVFPNDALVWIGIPIQDDMSAKVKILCSQGFEDPHISKKKPSGEPLQNYTLCMLKRNDNRIQNSSALGRVKYVLSEFHRSSGICEMEIVLTSDAIRYLRDLQKIGMTVNGDGTVSQKEMAGNLVCKSVDKDLVHHLDINYDSIIIGSEMGVPISPGLYNFHSHPREAYSRAKVKYGWPSAQDYIGFFMGFTEDDTILHLVTSLEGVYFLSMSEYSLENKEKLSTDIIPFIRENYNLCNSINNTPVQYTREINNILYEDNRLFIVQYVPWYHADDQITVSYKSSDSNCFTSDTLASEYQDLYK